MALAGALFGIFYNQGEVCSAGSRILVEKSIHKKLVEAMAERAQQIRPGDGLDPSTKMGPLVTAGHRERVEGYIQIGKQSGIGRELGKYGIENYLQAKQVYVNLQNKPVGW